MAYTLIGSPLSYFTGKVRGYLRWKGVSYEEQMSNRDVYVSTILPRVGWAVIPIMITDDDQTFQDTSDIIDEVEKREGGMGIFPDTPKQNFVARLFELFGDEWMVLPAMHYRWNYNEEWAYGQFGMMQLPDASKEEQYEAGKAAAQRFKGFVPQLGVNEASIPAIEARYEAFLADFSKHLETHPFLLGSRPSIGDYGLLGPMYAHLYRDPASGEIMKRLAPKVADWTLRTHEPRAPQTGEFLTGDEVPETLLPIVAQVFEDQFPFLATTAKALNEWAADKTSGESVPRGLGMAEFSVGGAKSERVVMTFSLWMLQKVRDTYNASTSDGRDAIDQWLNAVGGKEAWDAIPDFPRLTRQNYRLVLE